VIAGLQLATIAMSGGDVGLLGEAYAFGVVWSFFPEIAGGCWCCASRRHDQEYKFPANLRIGKIELADRPGQHHHGARTGGDRESVFEADRDDLRASASRYFCSSSSR